MVARMAGLVAQKISDRRELRPARSSARYLVVAIVLMTLSVAIFYFADVSNEPAKTAILVVQKQIPSGARIQDGDLSTVRVTGQPPFAFVAGSNRRFVVGRLARVRLDVGTVLHRELYGEGRAVAEDEAVVSLALRRGQTPELAEGNTVALVGPSSGGSGPLTISARVQTVTESRSGDEVILQLVVKDSIAPTVALAGRAGQFTVVLYPPKGPR